MYFSSQSTNKANNIYVLGKDLVQGKNGTTIYAERIYKHNFTTPNKTFVLSLHYNGDNSYLFVNGGEELKFKTKNSEIQKNVLCVGNISSGWNSTESTKTGLHGNVYDFALDYVPLNGVKAIYEIHRHLMKKHDIVQNV